MARTKRYRERGLEPTKPELIAYARPAAVGEAMDDDAELPMMWALP